MKEIERKFLVDIDNWPKPDNGLPCKQGYIFSNTQKSLRVRIIGDKAYLTIKANDTGISRYEFEYEIPVPEAQLMLDKLCEGYIISKTRYNFKHAGMVWEVDVFEDENTGLVIAEVELENIDQPIDIPNWATDEVTDDPKYFNSQLSKHPYSNF